MGADAQGRARCLGSHAGSLRGDSQPGCFQTLGQRGHGCKHDTIAGEVFAGERAGVYADKGHTGIGGCRVTTGYVTASVRRILGRYYFRLTQLQGSSHSFDQLRNSRQIAVAASKNYWLFSRRSLLESQLGHAAN
jgi:hypothetical protein